MLLRHAQKDFGLLYVVRDAWRMVCHAWLRMTMRSIAACQTDAKLERGEHARCVECHASNHLSA